jgi:hypothetical protein
MAITIRPLTVANVTSVSPLFGASLGFYGMVLHGRLGYAMDTNFRVCVRHLPS